MVPDINPVSVPEFEPLPGWSTPSLEPFFDFKITFMKHRVYLNFTINDFEDITHYEISQRLGMIPYRIYVKGEKRHPDFPSTGPFWRANKWIMASPLDEYSLFEDRMNATLDIIEHKIDLFRPFCEKYRCEFACAVYLRFDNGESIPSIYLGTRYNRLIKELNIGFDVDLYVFPNKDNNEV